MKMTGLADVWRILKEVDLDALRETAKRPFRLLLIADEPELARDMASALSGGEPHPWIRCEGPWRTDSVSGSSSSDSGSSPGAAEPGPELALCAIRGESASDAVAQAIRNLSGLGVPVVTVALGAAGEHASAVRTGETARVVLQDLQPESMAALGQALSAALSGAGDRRLAFARELPLLRDGVLSELIEETSRANAAYALTAAVAENVPGLGAPLSIADMFVLTKNQLVMAYRIALASGRDGEPKDVIGELVGVIGGGFLFRQASRQLIGLVPVVGIPAKVAIAYAGTYTVGRAATTWARERHKVSPAALKSYYREARARGASLFKELRQRKTS